MNSSTFHCTQSVFVYGVWTRIIGHAGDPDRFTCYTDKYESSVKACGLCSVPPFVEMSAKSINAAVFAGTCVFCCFFPKRMQIFCRFGPRRLSHVTSSRRASGVGREYGYKVSSTNKRDCETIYRNCNSFLQKGQSQKSPYTGDYVVPSLSWSVTRPVFLNLLISEPTVSCTGVCDVLAVLPVKVHDNLATAS